MSESHALLLHPETPDHFIQAFSEYIWNAKGINYFVSSSVSASQVGPFISILALKNTGTQEASWNIQIPTSFVFSIVEVSEKQNSFGFIP